MEVFDQYLKFESKMKIWICKLTSRFGADVVQQEVFWKATTLIRWSVKHINSHSSFIYAQNYNI